MKEKRERKIEARMEEKGDGRNRAKKENVRPRRKIQKPHTHLPTNSLSLRVRLRVARRGVRGRRLVGPVLLVDLVRHRIDRVERAVRRARRVLVGGRDAGGGSYVNC